MINERHSRLAPAANEADENIFGKSTPAPADVPPHEYNGS